VYSRLYSIPALSLRTFSVFGPRQRKQVIYDLLCKLDRDSDRLSVLGDGTQRRDFNYVDNVVDAMLLVAERAPMRGEVYNVASGVSISISELVQMICKVVGVDPQIEYSGAVRPGDAERWVVDISRLQGLGYEPGVGLRAGLQTTYQWYKAHRSS
jgi:UDP-glucose 4-epimerase